MFGKKQPQWEEKEILPSVEEGSEPDNIDTSNIFEEFTSDDSLTSNLEDLEQEVKKDVYHYIRRLAGLFKFFNVILFIILVSFTAYYFVQTTEKVEKFSFLNPVCEHLLWTEVFGDLADCYTIVGVKNLYQSEIQQEQERQVTTLTGMIPDVYAVDNFLYSDTVLFLSDRSKNRFKALKILSEFDVLKNTFESVNKNRISCSNIQLTAPGWLSLSCDMFSTYRDDDIPGASRWGQQTISGTSLSFASSFLNFLQENASEFQISSPQQEFSVEPVVDNRPYIQKTRVDLDLIYIANTSSF